MSHCVRWNKGGARMYDRNNVRGQGSRYADGYGASDGFMERFDRMGQDMSMGGQSGYGQPMGHPQMQPGMQPGMQQGPGMQPGMQQMPQGGMPMQHGGMPGAMPMPGQMPQGGMPMPGPMPQPQPQQGIPEADLEALRNLAAGLEGRISQMEEIYNRNAACVDEIREVVDGQDRRIRTMMEELRNAPQQDGAGQPAGSEQIDAAFQRIEQLMDERAQADLTRRQADAMRSEEMQQSLEDLTKELKGACEKIDAAAGSLSGLGDDVGGRVSDGIGTNVEMINKNTHDVGVRVYRNVQASMSDFLAKQTSTLDTAITSLNQRMETMEDSFLHRRSASTPLTVAALVTGLVNLGILVAYILSSYL